ncbi:MAG: hypothetical protein AB8F65_12910 [Woeseiaceae bacterium]
MSSMPNAPSSSRFLNPNFSFLVFGLAAISPLSAQENEQSTTSLAKQIDEIVVTWITYQTP